MKCVCDEIKCPYWYNGTRTESGSLGNYGCQRYGVAVHCHLKIEGTSQTQYEIHVHEDDRLEAILAEARSQNKTHFATDERYDRELKFATAHPDWFEGGFVVKPLA